MAVKTYGSIEHNAWGWEITAMEPQVCIRFKALFRSVPSGSSLPYSLADTEANGMDLEWFVQRYPLKISKEDAARLKGRKKAFLLGQQTAEAIFAPGYSPKVETQRIREGQSLRTYQNQAVELVRQVGGLLLGDELGLGKTVSAIGLMAQEGAIPAVVVVQAHLQRQWVRMIEQFSHLRVHAIKGGQPYPLPKADVYVIRYMCLAGWVDVLAQAGLQTFVADEAQEYRREGSTKYRAGTTVAGVCRYRLGLSATPIFNYGDEIYSILNVLQPGALGSFSEFVNEWCTSIGQDKFKVKDPEALGAYLREARLFLRRERKDEEVNLQLPRVEKIEVEVEYQEKEVRAHEELLKTLAIQTLSGESLMERGRAAMELDIKMRQAAGLAKARPVAAFVREMLTEEPDRPVVLVGWHREVYRIWLEELADHSPVLYTGSESLAAKDNSLEEFISGRTKLLILSLRSGAGINGLQEVCNNLVFGELDWSPAVHEQVIGRLRRDGQSQVITVFFMTTNYGADPLIIDRLAIKGHQAEGITNPFGSGSGGGEIKEKNLKEVAREFLAARGIKLPENQVDEKRAVEPAEAAVVQLEF